MHVRTEARLTREDIAKVVATAVDQFNDDVEVRIADIRPGVALEPLCEPIDQAARVRGHAALHGALLDRNKVEAHVAAVCDLGRAALGKEVEEASLEARRLARAVLKGLQPEMHKAAEEFDRLASRRPAAPAVRVLEEGTFEPAQEILDAFERAQLGDNLQALFDQLVPVAEKPIIALPTVQLEETIQTKLRNGDVPFITLWPEFCRRKVLMKEWGRTEALSITSRTPKLWVQCCGDLPPKAYTCQDVSKFHEMVKGLPSNYYHSKMYRTTYESQGALAVVEMSKCHIVDRISDKTWNSLNSQINQFFLWCADKGEALPKGTVSICEGESVKIDKPPVRKHDDPARIFYTDDQIRALFSAPKFMGARSGHYWKRKGNRVVRDHRYWMALMGAFYGNRREEPAVLKVKHVRSTASGVVYFNWKAPELASLLKAIGSPRDVPLHRDFLALGFMEARVYGRDPEAPLFPEAVSHAKMERKAESFGSWFGRFRRACGVDDPLLDYHAWRHTVTTLLKRAGVPDSHIEELIGHESETRRSEMATYDHGLSIELLKEAIDKLVLPIDVEALNAAVARSDAFDRSAAWPDLSDPGIVPKAKRVRTKS